MFQSRYASGVAALIAVVGCGAPALCQSLQGLGLLPKGTVSQAFSVSADGLTVVGYCTMPDGDHAIRWTEAGGMEDLGLLQGDTFSYAWARALAERRSWGRAARPHFAGLKRVGSSRSGR